MPAALQADELGDILQVLAENELIAARQHRHGANPQFSQPLECRWLVQYIERQEVDAFFRKKLFRSKAAASTRLGKENESSVDIFNGHNGCFHRSVDRTSINRRRSCQSAIFYPA